MLVIASVEGAVAKCKAERSITPLDDVAPEIRALLSGAPVYRGQLTEPHDTTPPTDQE